MSLNKVQKIINLAYNFYRIASDEDDYENEDVASDWNVQQIKTSEHMKKIVNKYDDLKEVFNFLKTARNQEINVLAESDENSIVEYYSDFFENITDLLSIAMVYEKEYVGYEDLKDKIEFIQSEYFEDEVVDTDSDQVKSRWNFISEYVDSIEQNIFNSEYLKNKAIENETLDLSHESSEEYQKIKQALIDNTIQELVSEEGKSVLDLGSNMEEDPKGKGSGISVRSADHIDLAAKNMEKFMAKKANIYNEIASYLINLHEKKYKFPSLKGVKFDSSGDVKNINNLDVDQLVLDAAGSDDFAKNSAKLIKAKFEQYKILLQIEDKYPELKALLDELKAKVKGISDNDWFGTDKELSDFKLDTTNIRVQNMQISQNLYTNNKKIQQINKQIELLESNPALDEEGKKSLNNFKIKREELSNISKQFKDELNKIKEKNKLNVTKYIAVNKQPGTFAYYKNRLNKIKSNLQKQLDSATAKKDIVTKAKSQQHLAEVNEALEDVEVQTQQINEIDKFIRNTYIQKLRNIEYRVVKPLEVQLEGVTYPENIDLSQINDLVNSNNFDPNKFASQLNFIKNKISTNIENLGKVLSNPKYSKGLSSNTSVEKFKNSLKNELNSISYDPKKIYDKNTLNIFVNKLKAVNNKIMTQLDAASEISSAYKSKSFVGTEGKQLAQSNLFIALEGVQNIISGKLTNEFSYAIMKNKAFKKFLESDGFKDVLEKRKQFKSEILLRATESEKRINELKQNFYFPMLITEVYYLVTAYISLTRISQNKISDRNKQINAEKIENILKNINEKLDSHLEKNSQDLQKIQRLRLLLKQTNLTVTKFINYREEIERNFFSEVRSVISIFSIKYKESNIGLDNFSEFYTKVNELNSEIMALKNLVKIGETFLISPNYETEKEIINKINSFNESERNNLKLTKRTTNSDIISVMGVSGKNLINISFINFKQTIEDLFNSIKKDNSTFDNLQYDLRIYDIQSSESSIQNFIKSISDMLRLLEAYIQKLNIYEKAYKMVTGDAPLEQLKPEEELSSVFDQLEDEDLSSLEGIDFESVEEPENKPANKPVEEKPKTTSNIFDELEDEEEFIDRFFEVKGE